MERTEVIQNWLTAKYAWLKAKREEVRLQREYEVSKAQLYVDYPAKVNHYQRLNEIACNPLIHDLRLQLDQAHDDVLGCWIEVGGWQLELKMNPEVEFLEGTNNDELS